MPLLRFFTEADSKETTDLYERDGPLLAGSGLPAWDSERPLSRKENPAENGALCHTFCLQDGVWGLVITPQSLPGEL